MLYFANHYNYHWYGKQYILTQVSPQKVMFIQHFGLILSYHAQYKQGLSAFVAEWVESHLAKCKVGGSIPGTGTAWTAFPKKRFLMTTNPKLSKLPLAEQLNKNKTNT